MPMTNAGFARPHRACFILEIAFLLAIIAPATALQARAEMADRSAARPATRSAMESRVAAAYGNLPLSFEVNRGQTDARVKFLSHGNGYAIFLTPDTAVLSLSKPLETKRDTGGEPEARSNSMRAEAKAKRAVLRIMLKDANSAPTVAAMDKLAGHANYMIGSNPAQWHTRVPLYSRIEYRNVYPGIDLAYHGTNQRQLEYDFVVAPGANPDLIKLHFEGAGRIAFDSGGNLVIHIGDGELIERAPMIYQREGGGRHVLAGGYVLNRHGEVGFRVASYDRSRPLIIDPTLAYSTFLGTGVIPFEGATIPGVASFLQSRLGVAIALDPSGNAYVAGSVQSSGYPATAGAYQTTLKGSTNVFITELNPSGSALVYSTYLGGSYNDYASGIAVDKSGGAYVTGTAESFDFPTTPGSTIPAHHFFTEVFVSKLKPDGSGLIYSTLIGQDTAVSNGIAIDSAGNAYITGGTFQSFPFTAQIGACGASNSDAEFDNTVAFVSKLDPSGTSLVYSACVGGAAETQLKFDTGMAIAVDGSGHAFVAGTTSSPDFPTTAHSHQTSYGGGNSDAFVLELNTSGSALLYSTFFGGSGADQGNGIAIDRSGNAYITGSTQSSDFSITDGAYQQSLKGRQNAFAAKVKGTGNAIYATYLGGGGTDTGIALTADSSGDVFVTGSTTSSDFPASAGAPYTNLDGSSDAFITELDSSGVPSFSTFLGGSSGDEGEGITLDSSGSIYVSGVTYSADFPTTSDAYDTSFISDSGNPDAFVSKFGAAAPSGGPGSAKLKIVSPENGDTVSGPVTIAAEANGPITDVRIFVDGHYLSSSLSAEWDSTTVRNGRHRILVRGFNARGRAIARSVIKVRVAN